MPIILEMEANAGGQQIWSKSRLSIKTLSQNTKQNKIHVNTDKIGVIESDPGLYNMQKKCVLTTVWAYQHQLFSPHGPKGFKIRNQGSFDVQ